MSDKPSYRVGAEQREWRRDRSSGRRWSFIFHIHPKGLCHARAKADGAVACGTTRHLYVFNEIRWDAAEDLDRCPQCLEALASQ